MFATIQLESFHLPTSSLKTIHNYNFACCFVWMWNLISHTTGRTYIEGIWEQHKCFLFFPGSDLTSNWNNIFWPWHDSQFVLPHSFQFLTDNKCHVSFYLTHFQQPYLQITPTLEHSRYMCMWLRMLCLGKVKVK